jgi:hypothetical protein
MNAMATALLATNILLHPYWEIEYYPGTDEIWWMRAHTTTNAPFFYVTSDAEHGWTSFRWTDDLVGGEWEKINFNHEQYFGPCVFKIYMHPQSELTAKMMVDMSGFFPSVTNDTSGGSSTNVPPIPGE